MRVAVVTPEGAAFEGTASAVVVPAHDGEVCFWPGHAPFVGALGAGEIRVLEAGGMKRWYLEGGVVQVVDDVVTVLAEVVRAADKVDLEAARKDLAAALASTPTTDPEFADRDRRLASASARIRVAGG
jgi:F-type H+-transporting ATPase subunit epsilon